MEMQPRSSTCILDDEAFYAGAVVKLAPGIASVQSSDGSLIARDDLGYGLVQRTESDGAVQVFWTNANIISLTDPQDLIALGPRAHLVTVYQRDKDGNRKFVTGKVFTGGEGLTWNWDVEVLPNKVIRTLRSDGSIWTFDWYEFFNEAHPEGTLLSGFTALQEDDHAEALAVAELAMG